MAAPFGELSCGGLTVITPDQDGFAEAVTSKAFILNVPGGEHLPDAVLVCTTTAAVQASIKFCKEHQLKVSPRTGGSNWFTIWLQGKGSVILDVGSLDTVEFNPTTETIVAGPGARSVNTKIPKEYFFPSGHCPTVPLGGFILGGGYGIGFPKYGLGSALVKGIEVVLASGEVRHIEDTDDDPEAKALMQLVRGSYHHFPGVITKYKLKSCKAPQCVLSQQFLFDMKDWKVAVQYGRDIMHRGEDKDFSDIETTIVFCHCPPDLAEATGISKMIMLSLMIWSDEDEATTRATLERYTKHITGTIVPSTPDAPLDAHTVPEGFASFYPEARYLTEGFVGDESVFDMSDNELCELLQPLAMAWMSDSGVPGPPSHTLFVLVNRNMREVNGCDLATGFSPSFELLFYAIFQDASLDEINRSRMRKATEAVARSRASWTVLPEGDIRSGKESFRIESKEILTKMLKQLDPNGVFMKK
jgi:FAD binding domain